MNRHEARHWLTTKLDEEREIAQAQGSGWERGAVADAMKAKYEGTDDWLQMQAAISSQAIRSEMLAILQRFARRGFDGRKLSIGNIAELDGREYALAGLELRSSYVIDTNGREQAAELMTGDEARNALRILDGRIADDTVSKNRLQAALHAYPAWVGERTLKEVIIGWRGGMAA